MGPATKIAALAMGVSQAGGAAGLTVALATDPTWLRFLVLTLVVMAMRDDAAWKRTFFRRENASQAAT